MTSSYRASNAGQEIKCIKLSRGGAASINRLSVQGLALNLRIQTTVFWTIFVMFLGFVTLCLVVYFQYDNDAYGIAAVVFGALAFIALLFATVWTLRLNSKEKRDRKNKEEFSDCGYSVKVTCPQGDGDSTMEWESVLREPLTQSAVRQLALQQYEGGAISETSHSDYARMLPDQTGTQGAGGWQEHRYDNQGNLWLKDAQGKWWMQDASGAWQEWIPAQQ